MHGARGDVPVVAFLLGRADDELAVLARDEVEVVALDERADGAGQDVRHVRRVPQAQDLALDRADRGADLIGDAVEGAGGVAGRDDDVPRGEGPFRPSGLAGPGDADLAVEHLGDGAADRRYASRGGGRPQGGQVAAVVDGQVAGGEHAAAG